MKKGLIIAGLLLTFGALAYCTYDVMASPDCNILNRRGCCSYHNGVCGCQNGRAKCCDGSLSPSCGCD